MKTGRRPRTNVSFWLSFVVSNPCVLSGFGSRRRVRFHHLAMGGMCRCAVDYARNSYIVMVSHCSVIGSNRYK